MSTFFIDTSALAKRYITEIGSAWVRNWTQRSAGNVTVITELTTVEMFSLFARRVREGSLLASTAVVLRNVFLLHVEKEYLTVALERQVLIDARDLVTKYPLRSLDAIQLASALRAVRLLAEPMTFVSADRNLLSGAATEGFGTDDPTVHP